MNIFKRWTKRRTERRRLKELSTFASGFGTLERMEKSGLLEWNQKQRQLFIDQSLALVMMSDADSWANFLNNVFLWQYSKLCQQAWADYFLKEELAAVREYRRKHKGKVLGRRDVDRIRQARREEVAQGDMAAPKVESFEFFIVGPPDLSAEGQDQGPVGTLVAVGHYDPDGDRIEMAPWSDVERLIGNQDEHTDTR